MTGSLFHLPPGQALRLPRQNLPLHYLQVKIAVKEAVRTGSAGHSAGNQPVHTACTLRAISCGRSPPTTVELSHVVTTNTVGYQLRASGDSVWFLEKRT